MTDTLSGLLAERIAANPAIPLITYYDRDTGERTELSGTTFANWVAKTANLLRDDFDVHDGSVVALALPMHWQQLVIAFATWSLGGCVSESPGDSPDVLVMSPDRMMELADADAGELMVSSLDPMGRALEPRPEHVADYTSAVRVHGDAFTGGPIGAADPAYVGGSLILDHAHAAQTARSLAQALQLAPAARVLVTVGPAGEAGLLTWAAAPLLAGASLVLVKTGEDADTAEWLERIRAQEAITTRL
ncbi:MAG: TIGR03089 family protein [Cumulibacter sp.]